MKMAQEYRSQISHKLDTHVHNLNGGPSQGTKIMERKSENQTQ